MLSIKTMSYVGTVSNGVVVLPADAQLKEGTRVRVEPLGESPGDQPIGKKLQALDGIAQGLPADMAVNHDHYLHGTPKRSPS